MTQSFNVLRFREPVTAQAKELARTRAKLRMVARSLKCPLAFCKASVGYGCVNSLGSKLSYDEIHVERKDSIREVFDAIRSV